MNAENTMRAEDVREALAREIADGGEPFDEDFRAADDVLRRFEVRPRGTVAQPISACCDVPGGASRCIDCPLDASRKALS